jgi:hypothetical protein
MKVLIVSLFLNLIIYVFINVKIIYNTDSKNNNCKINEKTQNDISTIPILPPKKNNYTTRYLLKQIIKFLYRWRYFKIILKKDDIDEFKNFERCCIYHNICYKNEKYEAFIGKKRKYDFTSHYVVNRWPNYKFKISEDTLTASLIGSDLYSFR